MALRSDGAAALDGASILSTQPVDEREDDDGRKYINQYTVIRTLGKGAFGKVKLVEDQDGNEKSIKILNKSLVKKRRPGQKDMFQNVLREVAIMKKLVHPNTVRLFEAMDDPENNKIFLVLEYVSGGTVEQYFATDPPTRLADSKRFFRDVVCGLTYLHFNNIVHRDVKPDNMLLDKTGHVKLTDFGVSTIVENADEELASTAGTPCFLAPECCKVGKYKGPPVDVWAAGVTLYYMAFKKVPFINANIMELYSLITETPHPVPETADPDLMVLIDATLDKNPDTRIKLEDIKKNAWLTNGGSDPFLCTDDMTPLTVTDAEIKNAFKTIDMFVVMLKIKQRMNSLLQRQRKRSISGNSPASLADPATPDTPESVPFPPPLE